MLDSALQRAHRVAKTLSMSCPCRSGKTLEECCGPFLNGTAWPSTAEALMRARYSAFATGNVDFIHESHEPASRGDLDREQTEAWSSRSEWNGFDVLSVDAGGVDDDQGTVEFVAHYAIDGNAHEHHEIATFSKIDDKWYFVDGVVAGQQTFRREGPKVGRNDPCPCGSGKKFKKCCGRAA